MFNTIFGIALVALGCVLISTGMLLAVAVLVIMGWLLLRMMMDCIVLLAHASSSLWAHLKKRGE